MIVATATRSNDVILFEFPPFSDIQKQFAEWEKLTAGVRTAEQAKEFEEKYCAELSNTEIEINGYSITDYMIAETLNISQPIEWIRYECFGENLGYIYDRFDGNPILDIYCNEISQNETPPLADAISIGAAFITDVHFSALNEENYMAFAEDFISSLNTQKKNERNEYSVKYYPELSSDNLSAEKIKEIVAEVKSAEEIRKAKSGSLEK